MNFFNANNIEQSTVLFLLRDTMRKRGLCCRAVSVRLSVRLSVCLSVTFVYCIQKAEHIVKLPPRPGSPGILVFDPERCYPIPRGTLQREGRNTLGWENLQFSTEITVYFGNSTR